MLLLDASSEQLNDGNAIAQPGSSDWDFFRALVAQDDDSLFNLEVDDDGVVASQVIHFGLITFGNDTPGSGEQKRVVDYWPCSQPNIDWALDPSTSCDRPGCTDPYGTPPIEWTFLDGSESDPPDFEVETLSHMPRCESVAPECRGSTRHPELGVALATSNRMAHPSVTPWTADESTLYANILLLSGPMDGSAEDAQAALEEAFDAGITTYVVGFGEGVQDPTFAFAQELDDLASWGSADGLTAWQARNIDELRDALSEVLWDMELPCCRRIDCSHRGGAGGGNSGGDSGSNSGGGGGDGNGGGDDDTGGWGGLSDSAGDSTGGDGGSTGTDPNDPAADSSGEIDDDGGCTCQAGSGSGSQAFALFAAVSGWLRRRKRGPQRAP